MSVTSLSSTPVRRAPQQNRSAKRVKAFLEAAEDLFAQFGFEAATMTAVAERAGSSIGALYSYFPDKKSLALALLDIYAKQIEEHWKPLFSEIVNLSAENFSERFIDRFLDFLAEHPAYMQLLAAPIRLRRSATAKRAFRVSLIEALRIRVPSLPLQRAELCANVSLQIVRGMMQMYNDAADHSQRLIIIEEFKRLLTAYLRTVFVSA
jgi:AcrR family transcriptional regulator